MTCPYIGLERVHEGGRSSQNYFECVGDYLTPEGIVATFPRAAKIKPGETVIFSWIVYRSRAHRDSVMKKVMADPRLAKLMDPSPFDMKRMVAGGFKMLVEE